jgi:dTDP-3,4-didehydro-2,6-dideoxy-alpha-D-glucose 3-reductase
VTGIAVWGVGRHAMKNVLPAIAEAPDYELIGVCSRNDAARAEAVATWRGESWASPEAMLESERVEVVYLSTPTGLHAAHGQRALDAGKHLICEKSLTSEESDARSLVGLANDKRLLLCEAFAFLHHARFAALRQIVSESGFGSAVHAFCCFGLPRLERPGFRRSRALGGGAMLDVGCYPVAAMRGLFGNGARVIHSRIVTGDGEDVDDGGDAAFIFPSGLRVDTAWGYNRAYSADLFVWGASQTLYANRVFSRDRLSDSVITLRDKFADAENIAVPEGNVFVSLLAVARRAMRDETMRRAFGDDATAQAKLLAEVKRCAR